MEQVKTFMTTSAMISILEQTTAVYHPDMISYDEYSCENGTTENLTHVGINID